MASKTDAMRSIHDRKKQVADALEKVQNQLFLLESKYLEETNTAGNVVRGWEGYSESKSRNQTAVKTRKKLCDPILSMSSITSPCGQENKPTGVADTNEGAGATTKSSRTKKKTSKRKRDGD